MTEPAQNEKVELYNALKEQGWKPEKHFREYNVDELRAAGTKLAMAEATGEPLSPADMEPQLPPVARQDEAELPGQRQNSNSDLQPIRKDEKTGRLILQEEVRKPASPRPRGRRVLKTMESDVVTETVKAGEYIESFEVEGHGAKRPSEVKITLPSFQVGISIDPRFKHFKIITYADNEGFDFFDVNAYYGGVELVPGSCKRKYVANTLCYEMTSVIRTIQAEFRQLQLQGKV